jgi:hypothetical protein
MFVIRSAFWLAIGFALVAPHGTDFGAVASQVKDQAMATGTQAAEQLIVGQILTSAASPATDSIVSFKPAAAPVRVAAATPYVFPRTRPAALS